MMTRSPRWPLACGECDGRPPLLACSRASMSNMRVKIPASSSSDILLAAGAETATTQRRNKWLDGVRAKGAGRSGAHGWFSVRLRAWL